MTDAELIELIIRKRNELEENRAIKVSNSLLRLQEDVIRDLEVIFANGDADRLDLRAFLDQCAEKVSPVNTFFTFTLPPY